MPNYCVNKNAQDDGYHEVHDLDSRKSCLPEKENQHYLGWLSDCHAAVRKAKESYSKVDGCAYCCKECHTR